MVNNGDITGVSDVRDESDRDGMRVVVELRRGANAEVVVNNLYKQTSLQTTFPCNMVALVDKTPQTLNLKQFLEHFLDFRSVEHLYTANRAADIFRMQQFSCCTAVSSCCAC